MKNLLTIILCIATAMSIISCGGSSGSAASSRGTLGITVDWPAPSRLIPVNSNTITVVIKDSSNTTVDTGTATKPADSAADRTTAVVFSGATIADTSKTQLLEGQYTVTATATSDAGSGAKVLAQGSGPMTIVAGATNNDFTVTMDPRVDHLRVNVNSGPNIDIAANGTAAAQTLSAASSLSITAAPSNGTGAGLVMLPIDNGTGPDEIQVTATGNIAVTTPVITNGTSSVLSTNVTATAGTGSGSLVITYRESGATFTIPVTLSTFSFPSSSNTNMTAGLVLNDVSNSGALVRSMARDTFTLTASGGGAGDSVNIVGPNGTATLDLEDANLDATAIDFAFDNSTGMSATVTGTGPWTIQFANGNEVNFVGNLGVANVPTQMGFNTLNTAGSFTLVRSGTSPAGIVASANLAGARTPIAENYARGLGFTAGRIYSDGANQFYVDRGTQNILFGSGTPTSNGAFGTGTIDVASDGTNGYVASSNGVRPFATTAIGSVGVNLTGAAFTDIKAIATATDTRHVGSQSYLWVLDGTQLTAYKISGTSLTSSVVIDNSVAIKDISARAGLVYVLKSGAINSYTADGLSLATGSSLPVLGGGNYERIAATITGLFAGWNDGTATTASQSGVATMTHN